MLHIALFDAVTSDGYDETVGLAASIQSVRGYEDIKTAAMTRWRADVGLTSG